MEEKTENKKYFISLAIIIGIFLIFILLNSRLMTFLFLIFLASTITAINYMTSLPVDFSPILFFSLVLTSELGLGHSLLFVILSGFVPGMILTGFRPSIIIYLISNILVNLLSNFLNLNNPLEWILISSIYFSIVTLVKGTIQSNFYQELLSNLISFFINIIYFLKFSDFLISIL